VKSGSPSDVDVVRRAYRHRRERVDTPAVIEFILTERRKMMRYAVERFVGSEIGRLRICDVGCGAGGDLSYWHALGVPLDQLAGTELLPDVLEMARRDLPAADLRLVDDFLVPWPDRTFDLTWSSMSLSSIRDDSARRTLFNEMRRVTRPGGVVAIYDFHLRKPTNHDVVAMNRSRVAGLGIPPDTSIRVTPFLPLLRFALGLPLPLRGPATALLPRTHTTWMWQIR
jgi:SAM-dependent methyltransferase